MAMTAITTTAATSDGGGARYRSGAAIGDPGLFLPGALLGSTGSHEHPRVAHDLKVPQVRPMLCHVEHGGTPVGHILPA
jgi:hypothetical protein